MNHISTDPFPHEVQDGFLDWDFYHRPLRTFPDLTEYREQGRTGYDLYRDDPGYALHMMHNPDWAALHFRLCSESFATLMREMFADCYPNHNYRFVDFVETRAMLYSKEPMPPALPGDLFVRMDIQSGKLGYKKPAHLDHDRRFASMLLYFCDQDECGMEGGELVLHKDDGTPVTTVEPRHNRAVLWPQVRNSYHSVNEIIKTEKPRNFLYVAVSSRVPIWGKSKRKTL